MNKGAAMRADIHFVESFYKEMEQHNIKYCILRNADEVEQGNAHDIDMTVDVNCQKDVEQLLLNTAQEQGWNLHLKTGSIKDDTNIKSYHLYKIIEREIYIVHFDFFPTFSWNGYQLLSNQVLLQNVNMLSVFHTANSAVEAVTKLFIRLLYNGYIKDKYKRDIYEIFSREPDAVLSVMKNFIDQEYAEYVVHMVAEKKWDDIEKNRDKLVCNIKKKNKRTIIKRYKYIIDKFVKRPGIMIVFEGTDGSGKSTIIEGIKPILDSTFPDGMFDYYHWRPGFIKKEKRSADGTAIVVTDPHAKKPYGKIKSFAKFAFFNLDYILGYWCKVRWMLAKGHLVVFDRYYYDYYLDKIRYRLDISDSILNTFKGLIPKPDITFLLIGDANILYERKREISAEEIQKQIDTLKKNKDRFTNSFVIDVNQSVSEVVCNTASEILNICAKRYL